MHSILLQATLRISYTSYIRQYIRRYSGSIGLGHCRGHCSNWPGLFFHRVMVILSSFGGCTIPIIGGAPIGSPICITWGYHMTGKHRRHHPATRCWPQHHEPSCWPCSSPTCCCLHSERALRSATTDKREDKWLQRFSHSHSHADHCHARLSQNVFAFFDIFSCFEIFRDISSFEFLDLPILLPLLLTYPSRFFAICFFCCFSFAFWICLYCFF